jgi:UDP-N-acetylglucosamine acyltransferase
MAEGNRAYLRGLNLTGLRRHIKRVHIDALKSAYRELFSGKENIKDVANRLLNSDDEFVVNLAKFVLNSKRGIPYKRSEV